MYGFKPTFITIISFVFLSAASAAEPNNGREYIELLEEMMLTPRNQSIKRARIAGDLEQFDFNRMNRGLSGDERIELAKGLKLIISHRDSSNRDKLLALKGAVALVEGRLGERGDALQTELVSMMRNFTHAPDGTAYSYELKAGSIKGIEKLGEVSIHDGQSYIDRIAELASLMPEGKPPQKPHRREAIVRALMADARASASDGKQTNEQRAKNAATLAGLFEHYNGEVQEHAIQAFGQLMSEAERGRTALMPEYADKLRALAQDQTPGDRPDRRREAAKAALKSVGVELDAKALVNRLAKGTLPTASEDVASMVKNMPRAERFGLASQISVILGKKLDPAVKQEALKIAELLIPTREMVRLNEWEQGIRGDLITAVDKLGKSTADPRTHEGRLAKAAQASLPNLGSKSSSLEEYLKVLEKSPSASANALKDANPILNLDMTSEEAQSLERTERFALAKRVKELLNSNETSPTVRTLLLDLVPHLLGSDHVQRLDDAERKVKDELIGAIKTSSAKAPAAGRRFSGAIVDKSQIALAALGEEKGAAEKFVENLEKMVSVAPSRRAALTAENRAVSLPELAASVEREQRFTLANRAMDAAEKSDSPTIRQMALEVTAGLIGKEHVARFESGDQSKVRSRALQLSQNLMLNETGDVQKAAIGLVESLGEVPVYNAESYVAAVEEFARLTPPGAPSPDANRRTKLALALRRSNPANLIGQMPVDQRARLTQALTGNLDHHNADVRVHAIQGLAELGAKGINRREIPEATLQKLNEAATIDRTGDGDTRAKQAAISALSRMGREAKLVIRTAREYADALTEYSQIEGQPTERNSVLREALSQLDLNTLGERLAPGERRYVVKALNRLIDGGGGIKSRDWAIRATGHFLATPGYRGAIEDKPLVQEIEGKLWKMSHRKDNELIVDRRARANAIESLKQMGHQVIETPQQYVEALESLTEDFKRGGKSAQRAILENAIEHFNLAMTDAQMDTSGRRELTARVAKLVADPAAREQSREIAIESLGALLQHGKRSGVGIPGAALDSLRQIASASQGKSPTLHAAASQALQKMQLPATGMLPISAQMEIYEPTAKGDLGEVIAKLSSGSSTEIREAMSQLEAWTARELTPLVFKGGVHAKFPAVLAGVASHDDPQVREALMRHLWRWTSEPESTPAWLTGQRAFAAGVVNEIGSGNPRMEHAAIELLGKLPTTAADAKQIAARLNVVIRSPTASEESRHSAAKALALSPHKETVDEVAEALRIAFARADWDHKKGIAQVVDSFRRQHNHKANSAAYAAARWMLNANSSQDLMNKVGESLRSPSVEQQTIALEALHWLMATKGSGRPQYEPNGHYDFVVPEWMVASSDTLVNQLMPHLASENSRVRSLAANLLTSRQLIDRVPADDRLLEASLVAMEKSWKNPTEVAVAALAVARSDFRKPNADQYLRLLRTLELLNPTFHSTATKAILDKLGSVEAINFDGTTATRRDVMNAVSQGLESSLQTVREGAAVTAGSLVGSRTRLADVPQKEIETLANKLSQVALGDSAESVQRAAERTLTQKMQRPLVSPVAATSAKPAPAVVARRPLAEILGDLMNTSESVQLRGAQDLAAWAANKNGGRTVLTSELEHWERTGGPQFDQIIADVLTGEKYETPLAVRQKLITSLRELAKSQTRGFEPALENSAAIQGAIAHSLFDSDPAIRAEAETLARKKQMPTTTLPGGKQSFEQVIAAKLGDSKSRDRAFEILTAMTPKTTGYFVPKWLSESAEIQGALAGMLTHADPGVRQNASHHLLHRLKSNIAKGAVEPLLNVARNGDDRAQVLAMEALSAVKTPNRSIAPALRDIATHDKSPEVQAEAIRALGFRDLEKDLGYSNREVQEILRAVWQTLKGGNNPEARREAAGVIAANTRLLSKLPDRYTHPDSGHEQVAPIHEIKIGLSELRTKPDPSLPESINQMMAQASIEVNFKRDFGKALIQFEASEAAHQHPTESPTGGTSRAELRSLRANCSAQWGKVAEQ